MFFFLMECSTFFIISFSVWACVFDGGELGNVEEVCLVTANVGILVVGMVVEAGVIGVWRVVGYRDVV